MNFKNCLDNLWGLIIFLITNGYIWKPNHWKKRSCDNRIIRKVLKDRVPILGLTKEHKNAWYAFPKGKKDKSKFKIGLLIHD